MRKGAFVLGFNINVLSGAVPMKSTRLPLTFLFLFVFSYSQAQLLAEETFSYTSVTTLNGQNGGYGWGNVWWNQNEDISIPGYNVTNVSPLNYSGFLFQGNHLVGGDNFQSTGRILNRNPLGPFAPYLIDGDGNTGDGFEIGQGNLWVGCMIRKNNSDTQSVEFVLSDTDIFWDYASNRKISLGFFGSPSTISSTRYWTLRLQDIDYYVSGIPIVTGSVYFCALNIRYNFPSVGTTSISLFLDPPIMCSTPTLAAVSATSTANLAFKNVAIHASDVFNGASFDEIRIGGTYCDIISMSVPLPVDWLGFNVSLEAEDLVKIEWKTGHEKNCDFFEIQESIDGNEWNSVGRQSASGNLDRGREYVYFHNSPAQAPLVYYRIKQVDVDGGFGFSKTAVIFSPSKEEPKVYYNQPARAAVIKGIGLKYIRVIRALDGMSLMNRDLLGASEYHLDMQNFADGCYLLEVITEQGVCKRIKMILN